jgi:hypothetical protein
MSEEDRTHWAGQIKAGVLPILDDSTRKLLSDGLIHFDEWQDINDALRDAADDDRNAGP